jgi:hypothetical protein
MSLRSLVLFVVVVSGLLAAPVAPATDTLRCDGRVVGTGDRDIQVRARCGDPYWVERRTDVLVRGEDGPLEQRVAIEVEVWYYNFGPNRLMQRLSFRDGVLVGIATLGYGVTRIGAGCRYDALPVGITTGEVVARCGRPEDIDEQQAVTIRRDEAGNALASDSRRETWRYSDGRTRWRELSFNDGRLVASATITR